MSSLKESRAKRIFLKNLPLLILTLPGLIYVIMFKYVPMFGVVIAFKDYNYIDGIIGSDWVGFKYFKFFFPCGKSNFGNAFKSSICWMFSVAQPHVQLCGSLD